MRLPRVRFTVRGLMVAVAVAAMICGGELMRRRRGDCLRRAKALELRESELRGKRRVAEVAWTAARDEALRIRKFARSEWADDQDRAALEHAAQGLEAASAEERRNVSRYLAQAERCARRARAYRRIARYPWLPIRADPPEPE